MQSIAAVIVTFNRIEKLQFTVKQTLAENINHIVIVNNASTDNTSIWLSSLKDDRIKVINSQENVGGAGGFYLGFQAVLEQTDADWLVCYDDDAYPKAGAIQAFRQLPITDDVIGVAAAVYLPNGDIAEMNRPSVNPFHSLTQFVKTAVKGRMGFHISDQCYQQQQNTEIDYSSFVGFFVRTNAIKQYLGLPRKELFIYADDIIYTFGIRQNHLRHIFAPSVQFVHDCVTLVNQKPIYSPLWKAFYTYRNGLELYRIISGKLFFLIALFKIAKWLTNARFYQDYPSYLKITLLAVKDGMLRDFSRSHTNILKISAKNIN